MAWASRARGLALSALLMGAALVPGGGEAALEPEKGLFPGERERLPRQAERDALTLLFEGRADLVFRAPVPPGPAAGKEEGVRWHHAWRNPQGFSTRPLRQGEPRPPMEFLGWGLTLEEGGRLAAAAFDTNGRLLGVALSPPEAMTSSLRNFLAGLAGREAGDAAARLEVFAEAHRGQPASDGAASWARLAAAFGRGREGASPGAPPPARVVPGYPEPQTAVRILAVILVVVLAGFANVALVRQRLRRQREAEGRPGSAPRGR